MDKRLNAIEEIVFAHGVPDLLKVVGVQGILRAPEGAIEATLASFNKHRREIPEPRPTTAIPDGEESLLETQDETME